MPGDQESLTEPVPRGRRRDPAIDEAVRAAVRELLEQDGYDAVSFQRVAQIAGVGQPAVYRRWPTKSDLVEAAVFFSGGEPVPPPTGDLHGDLSTLGQSLVEGFLEPALRAAIPGLLSAYERAPERRALLQDRALLPVRDLFMRILARDLDDSRNDHVSTTTRLELFDLFIAGVIYPALTAEPEVARAAVPRVARHLRLLVDAYASENRS
jgi:AcrR family transcriptional regulator